MLFFHDWGILTSPLPLSFLDFHFFHFFHTWEDAKQIDGIRPT